MGLNTFFLNFLFAQPLDFKAVFVGIVFWFEKRFKNSLRNSKKVLCLHPQNGACPCFGKFFSMFFRSFFPVLQVPVKKLKKKLEKVLTETKKGFIFAPA